uniref:Uncharacterized protein n=1 Tax=Plectus sambesii TaxID=2011161 RepID=A0A914UWS7_9BILA
MTEIGSSLIADEEEEARARSNRPSRRHEADENSANVSQMPAHNRSPWTGCDRFVIRTPKQRTGTPYAQPTKRRSPAIFHATTTATEPWDASDRRRPGRLFYFRSASGLRDERTRYVVQLARRTSKASKQRVAGAEVNTSDKLPANATGRLISGSRRPFTSDSAAPTSVAAPIGGPGDWAVRFNGSAS